jgi:hypothetical protein
VLYQVLVSIYTGSYSHVICYDADGDAMMPMGSAVLQCIVVELIGKVSEDTSMKLSGGMCPTPLIRGA